MEQVLYYCTVESPIGKLTLAKTKQGLCNIEFGEGEKTLLALKLWSSRWLGIDELKHEDSLFSDERLQLEEYFAGKRKTFDLKLNLYGTPFQKMVWKELLNIPYGETRSYKEIALKINAPKSVRAVGGANHCNPIPLIVPCHRVIGSNGSLVGYGGGLSIKEYLLSFEKSQLAKS